jgi:hypothetical protein
MLNFHGKDSNSSTLFLMCISLYNNSLHVEPDSLISQTVIHVVFTNKHLFYVNKQFKSEP